MRRGRWYNAKEQMFYFEKMVKLLSGEDGRIMQDENRTGQEIRKGDTQDSIITYEVIDSFLSLGTSEQLEIIARIKCLLSAS